MSTRAVIVFGDRADMAVGDAKSYVVYSHYDGYPAGLASMFQTTLQSGLAWELPRFEADEFACAFIAANKLRGGGMRLFHRWDEQPDIEYVYLVKPNGSRKRELMVMAYPVVYESPNPFKWPTVLGTGKPLFAGKIDDFITRYSGADDDLPSSNERGLPT